MRAALLFCLLGILFVENANAQLPGVFGDVLRNIQKPAPAPQLVLKD